MECVPALTAYGTNIVELMCVRFDVPRSHALRIAFICTVHFLASLKPGSHCGHDAILLIVLTAWDSTRSDRVGNVRREKKNISTWFINFTLKVAIH